MDTGGGACTESDLSLTWRLLNQFSLALFLYPFGFFLCNRVCPFLLSLSVSCFTSSFCIINMPLRMRKIALMGYRSVGKSTLTAQYIDGTTTEFYDPTVENSEYMSVCMSLCLHFYSSISVPMCAPPTTPSCVTH